MPVRLEKILDRHAGQKKIFQHTVLDEFHTAGRHALVVISVPTAKVSMVERVQGRIIGNAEKRRQNQLADLLGESLAFLLAALAMPFQAMSQDFMKKNGGRSSGKQRRTAEGFSHRRGAQGL